MAPEKTEGILTLARISCCIAVRNNAKLREEYQLALQNGMQPSVLREAVLQSYLFAGYAAAINAFITLNEVLPSEPESEFFQETPSSVEGWRERGEDLCRTIYGSQYEKLVDNMQQLHPDLADWMIWEGYGKVLARPFLSPLVRELLIVAMTAALQTDRQFYSHVRGALHVGAEAEVLRAVLAETKSFMDQTQFQKYESILDELITGKMPEKIVD